MKRSLSFANLHHLNSADHVQPDVRKVKSCSHVTSSNKEAYDFTFEAEAIDELLDLEVSQSQSQSQHAHLDMSQLSNMFDNLGRSQPTTITSSHLQMMVKGKLNFAGKAPR
jgi:hypothetical protein